VKHFRDLGGEDEVLKEIIGTTGKLLEPWWDAFEKVQSKTVVVFRTEPRQYLSPANEVVE